MTMRTNPKRPFFRLACQLMKYAFLALFTFAVTCIVFFVFGAHAQAAWLILIFEACFSQVAVVVSSVLATAIVIESLRSY